MDFTTLNNKYLIGLASGVGGIILAFFTQRILNKRGLFTYFVRHSLVGVSTDDAVFGSVRVTWNDNPVANLYSSTVELINQSMRDYESVEVRVYTNDTILLTERTGIVGTTYIIKWTEEFSKQLQVAHGQKPSKEQLDMYYHQRHYMVPTMNRGQIVRFHFLNAAKTKNQPTIWLDVLHKGVRLKFRVPQNKIVGVAQPKAALAGSILGFILVGFIITYVQTLWIAALSSLIYGFFAQIPGACFIRVWRWLRVLFGG